MRDISRLRDAEVLKELDSSAAGLSHDEAARRLQQHGPNSLQEVKGPPLTRRFLRHASSKAGVMSHV